MTGKFDLIYTHDIFSVQKYGGISRYFSELIKRLPSDKANIKVLAGFYINEYIESLHSVKGIMIPQLAHTGTIRIKINNLFQSLWLQGCRKQTIIHQTYYFPFSINRKVKFVVTIYDMIYERFPEYFSADDKILNLKRQWCEKADVIIAISESTKKDIVDFYGTDPKKIIVIYLGDSLKKYVYNSNAILPQRQYLLYVGQRGAYKNFNRFIQTFSQSKILRDNFDLLCFGGGDFNFDEEQNLSMMGIRKNVKQISGDDSLLVSSYKNASALVYPSLYEGFGLPLLEAMNLSCPVICSNTSSIPEVVGNAGIYFDPYDIFSMQKALEDTLCNEILLDDLRTRGFERGQVFSWEKCASETFSLYNSLAGN